MQARSQAQMIQEGSSTINSIGNMTAEKQNQNQQFNSSPDVKDPKSQQVSTVDVAQGG